jgi:hypothetical protein
LRALLLLLVTLALGGCPAAHSGYPDQSCMTTNDCFSGETCVISETGGTCVAGSNGDGGSP